MWPIDLPNVPQIFCTNILARIKLGFTPNFTFLSHLEVLQKSSWPVGWLVWWTLMIIIPLCGPSDQIKSDSHIKLRCKIGPNVAICMTNYTKKVWLFPNRQEHCNMDNGPWGFRRKIACKLYMFEIPYMIILSTQVDSFSSIYFYFYPNIWDFPF